MDEFEARIDKLLSDIESGSGELIPGLIITRRKVRMSPGSIEKWARDLAAEVSGLDD